MASLRKIMLVLGESKKVATLPAPSGNAPDIEVITDAAKELFVVSESEGKLLVQQYDDNFDEWIDINDAFVAKDKQKLKIVVQSPVIPLTDTLIGATESSVGTKPVQVAACSESSLLEVVQRPVVPTSNVAVSGEVATNSEGPLHKRDYAAKRSAEPPLPIPFSLPTNHTPMVMAGLQAGSLSGKTLTKFIGEIASAVFCVKSYPTREEKVHIALQCIKKYPFLESRCGSGFGYLVLCLEERLKYLRKPRVSPIASKRTCGEDCPQPLTKKPRAPKPVKPAVLPVAHGVGEDEDSNRRNVKMLQSLSKLTNPDPKAIEDLMTRTFSFRRSTLEDSDQFAIGSFVEMYPFLRQETQLIAEFDRVVEQQNASFLAAKLHWLELVPRILEAAKSEGNESIAHWLHQRSEASGEGADCLLAAIILAYILHDPRTKKDHSRIVRMVTGNTDIAAAAAASSSNQPSLLACGSFGDGISSVHLVMEKKIFLTVRKLTDAIPLLFTTYFVFNLCYESGTQSFYHFFEHVFLKTKLGRKQGPQKLIALLNM